MCIRDRICCERPVTSLTICTHSRDCVPPPTATSRSGRSQQIPDQTIGASYGAAMLAAETTSGIDTRDWACIGETVEPDPQHRELYDEIFGLYTQLYRDNRETMHRLAELQRRSDTPVQA